MEVDGLTFVGRDGERVWGGEVVTDGTVCGPCGDGGFVAAELNSDGVGCGVNSRWWVGGRECNGLIGGLMDGQFEVV